MKFKTARQMLDYINSDHDLYSPKAEIYVFNYNEVGSICTYDIDKNEAYVIADDAKNNLGEASWSACLGMGGSIWDDPSHECYHKEQSSNLDRCQELIEYDDWVLCEDYLENQSKR